MKEEEAIKWLKNHVKGLPTDNKYNLTRKLVYPPICQIVLFEYNAINGNVFGYWDKYPLVLVVRPLDGRLFGFNLHYLNKKDRLKIIKVISNINSKSSKKEIYDIYNFLNNLVKSKLFNNCYKQYSYSNFISGFSVIKKEYYDLIANLPIGTLKENKDESN